MKMIQGLMTSRYRGNTDLEFELEARVASYARHIGGLLSHVARYDSRRMNCR
jgi:hypothetical protein